MANNTSNTGDTIIKQGMTRMRYFDGLFLTENEFNLEQSYSVDTHRLHQRSFHGWGVVSGLEVTPDESPDIVWVEEGEAVARVHKIGDSANSPEVLSGAFIVHGKRESLDVSIVRNSGNSENPPIYLVIMTMKESAVNLNPDIGADQFINVIEEPIFSVQTATEELLNGQIVLAGLQYDGETLHILDEAAIGEKIWKLPRYAGFYGKIVQTDRLVLSHPELKNSEAKENPFAEMRGVHFENGDNGIIIDSTGTDHHGPLNIIGDATVSGDMTVGSEASPSNVDIDGVVHVHGPAAETETARLTVDGASIFKGTVTVGEAGDKNKAHDVDVYGKVRVFGDGNLDDTQLEADGDCLITGDTTLGSGTQTATVKGDLICTNNAAIQGDVTIGLDNTHSDLTVKGSAAILDDLEVADDTHLKGNTSVGEQAHPKEMRVYGGVHIGASDGEAGNGNLIVDGNCTIKGDLTMLKVTSIEKSEMKIDDNIITVNVYPNQPTPANVNGGIEVFRGGTASNAQLIWDEVKDKWLIGLEGSLQNLGYGPEWDDLVDGGFADHLHRHHVLFPENSVPASPPALNVDTQGNVGIGLQGTDKPKSLLHLYNEKGPGFTLQSHDDFDGVAGSISIRQGNERGVDLLYDAQSGVEAFKINTVLDSEDTVVTALTIKNNAEGGRGNVGIGTETPKERLHVANGNLLVEDGGCMVGGNLSVKGKSEFSDAMTIGNTSAPTSVEVYGNLELNNSNGKQPTLNVNGGSELNGGVDIKGDLSVGTNLNPNMLRVLTAGATPAVEIGGDCIVDGDLKVRGNTVSVAAVTVEIKDNTLLLNKFDDGSSNLTSIAGMEIYRGKGQKLGKLLWNEKDQKWYSGLNDVDAIAGLGEIISSLNDDWQTLTNGSNADKLHTHALKESFWQEIDGGITYNNGRVGIGTKTPRAKLEVAGAIMPSAGNSNSSGILFPSDPGGGSSDSAWMRYYPRSGESCTLEIGISNDADDHIALMPSGNVGIGTNTPRAKLEVAGAIMPSAGNDENSGILFPRDPFGGSGDRAWLRYYSRSNESTTLELGIANDTDDHIALMPSGNVGIGNNNPQAKLDVAGNIFAGNSDIYFTKTDHKYTGLGNQSGFAAIENAQDYNCLMILGRQRGSSSNSDRRVELWDFLGVHGDLNVDKTLTVGYDLNVSHAAYKPGGGSWATISDIKVKKNVKPLKNVVEKLLKLQGVSFEYKEPEKCGNLKGPQIGLVAQDVQRVFPEWVGSDGNGNLTVSIRGFEAMLVEVIREIWEKLENLTKKQ